MGCFGPRRGVARNAPRSLGGYRRHVSRCKRQLGSRVFQEAHQGVWFSTNLLKKMTCMRNVFFGENVDSGVEVTTSGAALRIGATLHILLSV